MRRRSFIASTLACFGVAPLRPLAKMLPAEAGLEVAPIRRAAAYTLRSLHDLMKTHYPASLVTELADRARRPLGF